MKNDFSESLRDISRSTGDYMGERLDKNRVEWIDLAKGLTMLLVIAGHSVYGRLRGLIFSFHMPLFFILSGLTYRCSTDQRQLWQRCKKAAVHLLLPALFLIGTDILVEVVQLLLDGRGAELTGGFWAGKALAILFSSGSRFYIGDLQIGRVGIPWFLIVLFVSRTLFDLLHLKLARGLVPVCILLTVAGVALGQLQWLPFSFDVALASLSFLLCGHCLRGRDLQTGAAKKMFISAGIWCAGILLAWLLDARYLELASRHYNLFPICYITAVAGTLMVCQFSVSIAEHLRILKRPLVYCGRHSLELLCVHTLDHLWEKLYQGISSSEIVTACIRIGVDLVIFMIYMFIKEMFGQNDKK